jgi:hypothetical protein
MITSLSVADGYRLPSGDVLSDPTRPEVSQQVRGEKRDVEAVSFTLNYIVRKGQERRAMINGSKVEEGDRIAGAIVKRIETDKVLLSYQGKLKELRLNKVSGIERK